MARIANTVRLLYLLLSALSLPAVLAQGESLLPSSASDSFPQCALNCALLKQAESGCVPPAAPASPKSIYVSCFCQSSLISSLHSSPANVCDDSCNNPSDLSLLQKWYNNYCSSGGNVKEATTTTTSPPTSTATNTADAKPASSASSSEPKSWWSTHYRWVIMIIVLAIGFTIIGVGGTYLKRRHDAKNPGLYHGADHVGSNSGIFRSAQTGSPEFAGPGQFFASSASRHVNPDTVPEGVTAPRDDVPRTRTPSRLQRQRPPEPGTIEIREVGR
ncbi:integral membrane protein [Aspergillus sclerotialis]|uniref:Integral membrane protein n=1 Tax=Aspergillus sclerotialis TaxID=2070753 RepID=A0A3A3ACY2_9EURO|nr:integral membrane protein [Aspergillus sclerotialis]